MLVRFDLKLPNNGHDSIKVWSNETMHKLFELVQDTVGFECSGRVNAYALTVDDRDVAGDWVPESVSNISIECFLQDRGESWWNINDDTYKFQIQYRHVEWDGTSCKLCR